MVQPSPVFKSPLDRQGPTPWEEGLRVEGSQPRAFRTLLEKSQRLIRKTEVNGQLYK